MKKKLLVIVLILLIVVSYVALPLDTKAKTIQQFEQEVEKYTRELEAKQANLAKNDAEVAKINKRIKEIENDIKIAEDEINTLIEEIKVCEEEIKEKSIESKNIISYYQIANGENAYLEYAFGATDITDMIYRLSVVEQLTEYNNKIMKELEELIEKNQKKQNELVAKEEELKKLKKDLQAQKERIEIDSSQIKESIPSIKDQIDAAKTSLTYYKKLGCKPTEDIQACEYRVEQEKQNSSLPSVGFFQRPISYGYIVRGIFDGHMGYDLSSSNKSIEVYPIAAGVVHRIYQDGCTTDYPRWCSYGCNGNANIVVVKHNYNGHYLYSSYVHLRGFGNISVGSFVTQNTVIGYMGTTGCSTGPHLHLEIADCFWYKGGCGYEEYKKRIIYPTSLINLPSSWSNR